MIRVVIEMDESGSGFQIRSDAPPPVVLAVVVTSAYHEMLSQKIRADWQPQPRIVLPRDGEPH